MQHALSIARSPPGRGGGCRRQGSAHACDVLRLTGAEASVARMHDLFDEMDGALEDYSAVEEVMLQASAPPRKRRIPSKERHARRTAA